MKRSHRRAASYVLAFAFLALALGAVDLAASQSGGQTGTPPRSRVGGELEQVTQASKPKGNT